MELIKLYGDAAILDGTTAKHIAEFERMAKEIKAKEDELKKAILEEMQDKGLIKLETDELVISFISGTTRETLNTKSLKEELPDIYDTYIEIKPVKPSIRIKLKG
jgi:ATP-dependent protease HslVU (ClpYQ) peptidase subunit